MGTTDEFGHFPDVDSNVVPSDLKKYSISPSVSAHAVIEDITTQTNLCHIVEKSVSRIQNRCDDLQKKLDAVAKNSNRKSGHPPVANERVNPKKRTPSLYSTDQSHSRCPIRILHSGYS